MATKKNRSILLYSDTAKSADALYFGGVEVPDPFVAFSVRGRKYAVVSALEFGRIKRASDFDSVLPLEACLERARRALPRMRPGPAAVMALLARELRAGAFTVPADFPAGLYRDLRESGVRVVISDGPLFPEREIKTPPEAAAVREGNRCSAAGIAAAEAVLRASRIRGGRLLYRGSVLTSERLKVAIEVACIEAGSISSSTIAAGGDQACDPHDRGSGPLRPNELIIVDVFPRVSATGYYGDMTRTFLRGRASDAQRAIVAAVRAAQLEGARGPSGRASTGREVHRRVTETFRGARIRDQAHARGARSASSTGRATGSASMSTSRRG